MLVEALVGVTLGGAIYSWLVEPRMVRVLQRDLFLQGSPRQCIRILHLSDFHFFQGQYNLKPLLQRLVQDEPDLIFITGDLIDDDSGIDVAIDHLQYLKARYGIFCVLGNHDFYRVKAKNLIHSTSEPLTSEKYIPNDTERLIAGIRGLGIDLLRNENRTVALGGETITLVGIDDPYTGHDDVTKAFRDCQKKNPCLVLVHAPESYQAIAQQEPDFVFMGHTHGGQVCLPFFGPLITRTKAPRFMAYGFNRIHKSLFYTTRGICSSRLTRPRFNCPPEVVEFFLHINPDVEPTTRD